MTNTPVDPERVKEIIERAMRLDSLDERRGFLQQTCGADPSLSARVKESFQAFDQAASSPAESAETLADPSTMADGHRASATGREKAPPPLGGAASDRVGRYKLLQKIGEGGCGVVYMAEQLEPVRRRVALKAVKLGMDTKEVIARFEAERQALAVMDHPNIARVLDAGTTETGRPYFVMELVHGVWITEFCNERRLSTRERLDLFVQVCHATGDALLELNVTGNRLIWSIDLSPDGQTLAAADSDGVITLWKTAPLAPLGIH